MFVLVHFAAEALARKALRLMLSEEAEGEGVGRWFW
jgi:hypothetical protein